MQSAYFRSEHVRISSATTAGTVIKETFNHLAIPSEDGHILVDGFPTLRDLLSTDKQTLTENSPASLNSIDKLTTFFD